MFQHMLVPLDGSDQSEQVGRWAGGLASGLGATMTLLGVPTRGSRAGGGQAAVDAQDSQAYLNSLAARIGETGVTVRVEVIPGRPAEVIVDAADRLGADVIALATRRVSSLARSVLGSVTDTVLHRMSAPVLVANPDALIVSETSPDVPELIIVPLDGSSLSETGIEPAISFAKACNAEIAFIRVIQRAFSGTNDPATRELRNESTRYLDRHVKLASESGLKARSVLATGVPAAEIMKLADETTSAIVVMTTHGHTGFRRAVLGSVCDTLVRSARTPVLVAPSSQ